MEKCNDEIYYWQQMLSMTQYINENVQAESELIELKKKLTKLEIYVVEKTIKANIDAHY